MDGKAPITPAPAAAAPKISGTEESAGLLPRPTPGLPYAALEQAYPVATPVHSDMQMWLFIIGWLIPVAHWVGACMGCCASCEYSLQTETRRARRFRRSNMAASVMHLALIAVLAHHRVVAQMQADARRH